jgi:hypothetical protein
MLMDHYAAAAWATAQGGSLPTSKQGEYLTTLKDEGIFKDLFNRVASMHTTGYMWLAVEEPFTDSHHFAWCQNLSGGWRDDHYRKDYLPVLACFR